MKPLLTMAAVLAALSASVRSDGAIAASGVQVLVVRGPTMPVCIAESPCSSPVPGALVVVRRVSSPASPVAARGRTDVRGRFRFALAPSWYTITVSAGVGIRPRASVRRVLVQSGRFTNVRFVFDTGIR